MGCALSQMTFKGAFMSMQTEVMEKEFNILLDIAASAGGDESPGRPPEAQPDISALADSPVFKEHGLDAMDLRIIAVLFANFLDGEDCMDAATVVKRLDKGNRRAVLPGISRIARLKESGIIEVMKKRSEEDVRGAALLRSALKLSDVVLNRICGFTEGQPDGEIEPYMDNLEYLSEQFERLEVAHQGRGKTDLRIIEDRIAKRLKKTNKTFPMESLKKERGLCAKEELVILALLERNRTYDSESLLDLVSKDSRERLSVRRLLREDGRLATEKIIELRPLSLRGRGADLVKLKPCIATWLLDEKKKRRKAGILEDESFFEVIRPSVTLDSVVLHPDTAETIGVALSNVRNGATQIPAGRGIRGSGAQSGGRKRKGLPVTMLFYGPPGTGKTLAANAISHKLKLPLLTLDCSRVLGCYVGESEQNTRKIFDRYREIAEELKKKPVLLLNEADQFLHRRISATRSTDHMYNQMQNIFLEQLEKFDGILIATTNLAENMDPAFSRRFNHKIQFRRPGAEERFKLWQILLPEDVRMEKDVDLRYLAATYDLSGGQIAVAVRNAAARAALHNGNITQVALIKSCEEEITGNFDEKARPRAGF